MTNIEKKVEEVQEILIALGRKAMDNSVYDDEVMHSVVSNEIKYTLQLGESVFCSNLGRAPVHGFEQVDCMPLESALSQVRKVNESVQLAKQIFPNMREVVIVRLQSLTDIENKLEEVREMVILLKGEVMLSKYNVSFPICSWSDLKKFDENLVKNKSMENDLVCDCMQFEYQVM